MCHNKTNFDVACHMSLDFSFVLFWERKDSDLKTNEWWFMSKMALGKGYESNELWNGCAWQRSSDNNGTFMC